MGFSLQKLTNFYIISTFLLFAYTFNQVYTKADNYFSAGIIYLDDIVTNFIFYNMVFSLGIIFYKISIFIFFHEVKENQTIKMVDKLKAKIIDVILFCYILDGEIQLNSFSCLLFIFFSYVIHCMATFRSEYLIHSPVSLSLNLNYRLCGLFLIIAFFDFQMLRYTLDLLYSQNSTHFIFAYYTVVISLSIIEPMVKFGIDFYEKYTLCHISNIDQKLATITLFISVPKLLIQIILAIILALKFQIIFYLIFSVIELISELNGTIKAYNRIKKLTDTMKNLKKITQEQIKVHHDNTCMVCFQDMTQATLLPCKHFFHDECLRQWIIKNANHFCPKCKKQFNFDNKTSQQKIQKNDQRQGQNQRQINERLRQQRNKRLEKIQQRIKKSQQKQRKKLRMQKQQNFDNIGSQQKQKIEQKQQFFYQNRKYKQQKENNQSYNNHKQNVQQNQNNNKKSIYSSYQPIQMMALDTPLQILQLKKSQYLRVGSLPYGLPTQAVYKRTYRHIYIRDKYQRANQQLIRDFSLRDYQQMMLFAQN